MYGGIALSLHPLLRELCTKRGFQAWGEVKFFWVVKMPILINRKDVVTSLGSLLPIYRNASVLRVVTAFLFIVLRKTDQKTARLCSPQDYLFFSWDVQLRTFAATCCYRRLNVIECAVMYLSLALFSRRTNTSSVLHDCGPMFSKRLGTIQSNCVAFMVNT